MTAFKAVVLEGLEVVFIVIAVGAGRGLLVPAGLGASIRRISEFLEWNAGQPILHPLSPSSLTRRGDDAFAGER